MTCRYTNADWLDVLYNSVRRTPGGVVDAARFLTQRRGKSIHPESLRAKLRGGDDAISLEMARLLSEWMDEKAGGIEYSRDWLRALNAQEGICADYVPPVPAGGWLNEADALQRKFLDISAGMGKIAAVTADTVADGVISKVEADKLIPLLCDARVILHRMERNVRRAAGEGQ